MPLLIAKIEVVVAEVRAEQKKASTDMTHIHSMLTAKSEADSLQRALNISALKAGVC